MQEHVKNLPPLWHVNIVRCCNLSHKSRSRFLTLAWGTEPKSTFLWKTRVHKSHAVMYMNSDGPRGREANLLRPLPNNKTCSTEKKQSHHAYSRHSAIPNSRPFQLWSWWYWSGHAAETIILLMVHRSYWPDFCMVVEVVLKQHGCSAGTKKISDVSKISE